MEQEHTLRLLVIEESRNDAEALANVLRNAGQASRLSYAEDLEDLQACLDKQRPDLLLCAMSLESLSLQDTVQELEKRELLIPLIAIGESGDEADII